MTQLAPALTILLPSGTQPNPRGASPVPAPRILPPTNELKRCVEMGMTHQQIVEYLQETLGIKVSRSSVSAALSRAGLTEREGQRYKAEIPWRVRGEHLTQYQARMLRLLGRRRAEIELSDEETSRLDAWLEAMEERGIVVAYAPQDGGFIYVEADEIGDGADDIPIRRRTIDSDEIPDSGEHSGGLLQDYQG